MNEQNRNLIFQVIGAGAIFLGIGGKAVNVYTTNAATQAVIIERIEKLNEGQQKILAHIDELRNRNKK